MAITKISEETECYNFKRFNTGEDDIIVLIKMILRKNLASKFLLAYSGF